MANEIKTNESTTASTVSTKATVLATSVPLEKVSVKQEVTEPKTIGPAEVIITTKEELLQTKVTQTQLVNTNEVPLPDLSDDLKSMIKIIRDSKDINSINLINGLLEYVEVMKPGNVMDPSKGSIRQSRLYRWYLFLFNQPIVNWDITFITVLKIVDEFKDSAFSLRYINRFISDMNLSSKDIESFVNINNLLTTIANSTDRKKSLNQVNVDRSLSYSVSQEGRQKVMQFLSK